MITNTNNQSWQTPPEIFERLHAEYKFTVDGAASIRNHKLRKYWTKAHDALKRSWAGERVFYNPPFRLAGEFIRQAIHERDKHGVFSVGLVLGSIETSWFHDDAARAEKHLFRRRVCYVAPPGVESSQPSFGSFLVICDPEHPGRGIGRNGEIIFTKVRDGVTGEYVIDGPLPF